MSVCACYIYPTCALCRSAASPHTCRHIHHPEDFRLALLHPALSAIPSSHTLCILTHTHKQTDIHTHTYAHTQTHASLFLQLHTHTQSTQTYTCAHRHADRHTCSKKILYMHTCIHTHLPLLLHCTCTHTKYTVTHTHPSHSPLFLLPQLCQLMQALQVSLLLAFILPRLGGHVASELSVLQFLQPLRGRQGKQTWGCQPHIRQLSFRDASDPRRVLAHYAL